MATRKRRRSKRKGCNPRCWVKSRTGSKTLAPGCVQKRSRKGGPRWCAFKQTVRVSDQKQFSACARKAAVKRTIKGRKKSTFSQTLFDKCMRAARGRGLGYVPRPAGSPQYVWKVGKRKGR